MTLDSFDRREGHQQDESLYVLHKVVEVIGERNRATTKTRRTSSINNSVESFDQRLILLL